MRCLCVVHKFKDITVVAFILSVSCVLSFTLSICFFYARSLLKEYEIETADRMMQFADWKSGLHFVDNSWLLVHVAVLASFYILHLCTSFWLALIKIKSLTPLVSPLLDPSFNYLHVLSSLKIVFHSYYWPMQQKVFWRSLRL